MCQICNEVDLTGVKEEKVADGAVEDAAAVDGAAGDLRGDVEVCGAAAVEV